MNKTTNITTTKSQRIINKFQELKTKNQCAFVSYICAGHPNGNISQQVLNNLPNAGVDIIELGVPFLDPAGDGPIIENASRKAIENGMTLKKTLIMVEEFRKNNQEIPIILMSYYNPILNFGVEKFFIEAENAGVDGLLVVDLPIEEQQEIIVIIEKYKIDLIGLIAPTTNEDRIADIAKQSSGFLYLISLLGITGTKLANAEENILRIEKIKTITKLPIVVGFGIKNNIQATQFANIGAEGVVIGSSIVTIIDEASRDIENQQLSLEKISNEIIEFSKAIKS